MTAALAYEDKTPVAETSPAQILYIGKQATEIGGFLSAHSGAISTHYVREVGEAMGLARRTKFDVIIVDQRDGSTVRQLIIPLITSMAAKVKLVVLCQKKDITQYLNTFGVSRVLTAPLAEKQVVKIAIDATPKKKLAPKAKRETIMPAPIEQPAVQHVEAAFVPQPPVLKRMKLKPMPRSIWKEAAIVAASFILMSMALLAVVQLFSPSILPAEVSELIAGPMAQFSELGTSLQWQGQNIGVEIFGLNAFI